MRMGCVLLAVLALGGCTKNECEQLAEKACGVLGPDSPECTAARRLASDVSEKERRTCARMMVAIDYVRQKH